MNNFIQIFNNVEELNNFLRINKLKCLRYDVVNNQIIALFERTAEVMLKYYDGKIFYEGENNFWEIARSIENQIIDENRDTLLTQYNLDLESAIQEMREIFVTDHGEEGSYDINNITDRDVDNIIIPDLSDSKVIMWNDRNEEYYHSIRNLFEI